MEGLIPFIYKAIKERRGRSYSRCGSASGFGGVDDDAWAARGADGGRRGTAAVMMADGGGRVSGGESEMTAHRRHRSLEDLAGEVGGSPQWQMPRGKSARIFSCIGGM